MPKIITNPNFVKQFRFPKTKKKRIRKKWWKNPKNHKPDTENFLCLQDGTIIIHPIAMKKVQQLLEERVTNNVEKRFFI